MAGAKNATCVCAHLLCAANMSYPPPGLAHLPAVCAYFVSRQAPQSVKHGHFAAGLRTLALLLLLPRCSSRLLPSLLLLLFLLLLCNRKQRPAPMAAVAAAASYSRRCPSRHRCCCCLTAVDVRGNASERAGCRSPSRCTGGGRSRCIDRRCCCCRWVGAVCSYYADVAAQG
jgi:hypothetical protein